MADSPSPLGESGVFPSREEEEQRNAAVVAEHLPSGYTAYFGGTAEANGQSSPAARDEEPAEESSLMLQGGDIHRHLFKINARAPGIVRANTFHYPDRSDFPDDDEMTAAEIAMPQGFRRQFVMRKKTGFNGGANLPITRNFVEFLDLYGAFAGEDLADSDTEEAIEDDDEEEEAEQAEPQQPGEERPLLGHRKPMRKPLKKGDSSTAQTFFTLLKAFIGTGIMFLPKAFKNGGILFSSLTMVFVATISMWAFHLLLKCRLHYGGSYGDIGNDILGSKMRAVILTSVTLSQIGFVCTGLVFVADNWFSFLKAVTNGASPLNTPMLIAIQAALLIPLSFIRNINKLGMAALVADAFILIGLVYIWYYDISSLATRGMDPSVQLFNPQAYTLTIGASIFTFEGIGLVIPIHASMRSPQKFEWLLATVMLIITCVYTSVGALSYATFGDRTQIEVINNYPQDSALVNAVQFLYALSVLVGNPVQLFPAMRILEGKIFGHRSGKKSLATKWKKNAFRASLVGLCVVISIAGSTNLDRFVALIGSVACVPLVYVYPALLHYKGVARSRRAKWLDIALMILGFVGMIYTTSITIISSFL